MKKDILSVTVFLSLSLLTAYAGGRICSGYASHLAESTVYSVGLAAMQGHIIGFFIPTCVVLLLLLRKLK